MGGRLGKIDDCFLSEMMKYDLQENGLVIVVLFLLCYIYSKRMYCFSLCGNGKFKVPRTKCFLAYSIFFKLECRDKLCVPSRKDKLP